MEAKDLMIGDWVFDKVLKSCAKVDGLQPLTIRCEENTEHHIANEYDPIDLSVDFFKKNGFEIDKFGAYERNDEYFIAWHPTHKTIRIISDSIGDCNFSNDIFINIEYVHELQHALRLCGLREFADNIVIE